MRQTKRKDVTHFSLHLK